MTKKLSISELARLLINDAHARGKHCGDCSPENCQEVARLHNSNDHSECRPGFCTTTNTEHTYRRHLLCNPSWCYVKKSINEAHANGKHDFHCNPGSCLEVTTAHNKNDHFLCKDLNCSFIKQKHEADDHSSCKFCDVVREIKERQSAHELGVHGSSCNPKTCEEVANSHLTDHKLCLLYDCKKIMYSHQTDHKLCGQNKRFGCSTLQEVAQAHSKNNHSMKCNNLICDTAKANQDEAHANNKHTLFCDLYSCSDVIQSHAADHQLCNNKFCDVVKKKHQNNDHRLCKWGTCTPRYFIQKAINDFLDLGDTNASS